VVFGYRLLEVMALVGFTRFEPAGTDGLIEEKPAETTRQSLFEVRIASASAMAGFSRFSRPPTRGIPLFVPK
jgi:hypothetical protein